MSKKRFIQQIEDELRLPTIIEDLPKAKEGIREGTKLLPGARLIDINRIKPDPQQARRTINKLKIEELAQSIKEKGILQPITVDYIEQEDCFRIITGYRRWLAAKRVGIKEVPCIIRLIELRGYKQKDLAEKIGKSKSYISESLALLNKLKEDEVEKVRTSKLLSKSLLREALRTKDEELRKAILNGKFTVREAREKVKSGISPTPKSYEYKYKSEDNSFIVIVKFKKQKVEQYEIIEALNKAARSIKNKIGEEKT